MRLKKKYVWRFTKKKEERGKIKECIYLSNKEVDGQLGRKMNQDIHGNGKFLWKKMSKVNGRMVKRCRMKDEVQKVWKGVSEDLYNICAQQQVSVHMCGFDGVQRGNYFGGEPITRSEGVGLEMCRCITSEVC